jgi:hypothetical protein
VQARLLRVEEDSTFFDVRVAGEDGVLLLELLELQLQRVPS